MSVIIKGDTRMLWRHVALGFVLAGLASSTVYARTICTVVADASTRQILVQQGDCSSRVTPASTFKIAISLMGFDSGFLKDAHAPRLPYRDGYVDWGGAAWRQTIYYPYYFASIFGRGTALNLSVDCAGYDADVADNVPYLDISGVHDAASKTLTFFAVNRHATEIVKALKEPDTVKLIEAQAIQIVASTPEEFAAFIKKDVVLWRDVARQAHIEVK